MMKVMNAPMKLHNDHRLADETWGVYCHFEYKKVLYGEI